MSAPAFDFGVIKRHPYTALFGTVAIAPLAAAPEISIVSSTRESVVYSSDGAETTASLLMRHTARIVLVTKDIASALLLVEGFSPGEDVMAPARRRTLRFTPATADTDEPELIFRAAWIVPELAYVSAPGGDHTARLTFRALPDDDGPLFVFE